jgi:serine/threonine-protein kinase
MGEVFAATHLGTGKRVAVKLVGRAMRGDVTMQRLHREALAAGRIESEFVPHVFDVDQTEDGELFLVMELLRGETLHERLRARGGALEWEEVRAIGDDVLSGLIDAHAAGVIHRDLKPANVFLEQIVSSSSIHEPLSLAVESGGGTRQRARILDFGVAKLDTPDAEKLTTTGEAVGTISYMAPEQIRGASKVDERADLYAFAMLVFESLAGRLPYDARGQVALLAAKLERSARSIRGLARVAYPPGLEALLARALARKAGDRFASAAELRTAWRGLGAATVAPSIDAARAAQPFLMSTGTTTDHAPTVLVYSSRASRWGLAAAAVALVAASAVLVVALRTKGPASPAAMRTAIEAIDAAAATREAASVAAVTSATPISAIDAGASAATVGSASGADPTSPRVAPRAPRRTAPKREPRPAASTLAPHISTEPRY